MSYTTYKNSDVFYKPHVLRFCGDETGYGLFKNEKPKAIAERIIRTAWGDRLKDGMSFVYKVHRYRGHNSLQDWVEVYYISKIGLYAGH